MKDTIYNTLERLFNKSITVEEAHRRIKEVRTKEEMIWGTIVLVIVIAFTTVLVISCHNNPL